MLNRAALIVRPAAPYLSWAKRLDDSGAAPDPSGEQTVYLVPEVGDSDEIEEILESVFGTVFERELYAWHTVEDEWPQDRTLAMFREWFEIEVHSGVDDLCNAPLQDDDGWFGDVVDHDE